MGCGGQVKKRGTIKPGATPKRLIFKLVANMFPGWKPEFAKENHRPSLVGFRLIDTAGKPRTHMIWFRKSRRYPLNKAWLASEVRQHALPE